MARALLVLLLALAAGSCAARRPDPALESARQAAEARVTAEGKVRAGCYDCLLEARTIYERLASRPERAEIALRRFEVEILLALREKELALDPSAALSRARALMDALPPGVDAARYLAIADAVPADQSGVSAIATRRLSSTPGIDVDAHLAQLETDTAVFEPVRQYLALTIDCTYLRRRRPPGSATVESRIPTPADPLLAYRAGTCESVRQARLEAARSAVPGFAEAAYFLARLHVSTAQKTGGAAARPLLAEAYERFAKSPSVTYLNGHYQQLVGDCKEAVRFYEETLALASGHENAMLGRTICLAFLKRFDEGIASATTMIDRRTYNMAEAYYWRAWIRHQLRQLDIARADIDGAKALLSNGDVHRLAGVIEHDQNDLAVAEKDLVAAKSMTGPGDCVARWYLGLVDMKRDRWADSAAHFEDAMGCYEQAAIFAAAELKTMQNNPDVDPAFKARQVAGFEAAIKEDTSQQYASAFNAANHHARAGNPTKARALLEIAAKDPALEARVTELRKILGGGSPRIF
jgi:tetratricopeptide (TPR) repeat protein